MDWLFVFCALNNYGVDVYTWLWGVKLIGNYVVWLVVSPPDITFLDYAADPPVIASQENGKEKEPERDKRDERPPINVTLRYGIR